MISLHPCTTHKIVRRCLSSVTSPYNTVPYPCIITTKQWVVLYHNRLDILHLCGVLLVLSTLDIFMS